MTFGLFKSAIEENLFESYKDSNQFKKSIKEFKQNILTNKPISKIFALYDELSSPQNLTEEEAKDFLNEGLFLIKQNLKQVKLPKTVKSNIENKYKLIDELIYENTSIDIKKKISTKRQIIETLKKEKENISESIKVPLKTMVKIANQTISNYLEQMDPSDRETIMEVLKTDSSLTEEKFNLLKEETINKLKTLISDNKNNELTNTIQETINKVQSEGFNQLSYLKLIGLSKSI